MLTIESTYFDKCDIYRLVNLPQPNGSTKQERQLVYSAIPCAMSIGTRPALNSITDSLFKSTDVANRIMTKDKLYLSPDYGINQGDEIVITRYGRTSKATAGLPFIYDTHQVLHVENIGYA